LVRVGFIVNPIAGIGGYLGLQGSDEFPLELDVKIGPAFKRAVVFLKTVEALIATSKSRERISFLTPNELMGERVFSEANANSFRVEVVEVCEPGARTISAHTVYAAERLSREAEVLFFVGGDGTACDVARGNAEDKPVVGVPGGTKMYSSVFAKNVRLAARLLVEYIEGKTTIAEAEAVLVEERALANNQFKVKEVFLVKTLESTSERVHQQTKEVYFGIEEEENKEEIAEFVLSEYLNPETLLILGPGSTTQHIAKKLGWNKPLMGIACGTMKRLYCIQCSSDELAKIVSTWSGEVRVFLSPLGRTGFILGRGTQALERALRCIEPKSIVIVATRRKMLRTQKLLVGVEDSRLAVALSGYKRVVTGYNEFATKKVEAV